MPRFKNTEEKQNMFLPFNLSKQLIPGTFEYTSNIVINKLDLSEIKSKYNNDIKGAKAYPPKILLKIIINAYAKGIISSRKIEAQSTREHNIYSTNRRSSSGSFNYFTIYYFDGKHNYGYI
jgi:transposase